MRQIGSVFDSMGKEYQLALISEQPGSLSFGLLVRALGRGWIKQENVSVSTSQDARDWMEEQLKKGSLKIA